MPQTVDYRRTWTDEEKALLRQLWPQVRRGELRARDICWRFGRSWRQLQDAARYYRLSRRRRFTDGRYARAVRELHPKGLTDSEIAQARDLDARTVGRVRCRLGLRRNRKQPVTVIRKPSGPRQGWGTEPGAGRLLPPYPTDALPGTSEKFAVLCERAAGRYALHHPDDAGQAELRERLTVRACSATRECRRLTG